MALCQQAMCTIGVTPMPIPTALKRIENLHPPRSLHLAVPALPPCDYTWAWTNSCDLELSVLSLPGRLAVSLSACTLHPPTASRLGDARRDTALCT
jgi:hypothetical protein